jgi:hypothetical protein
VPYSKIEHLGSTRRINKLLDVAKEDKIVVLEGRLKREEEAELIRRTMEEIDTKFKGIELAIIYPEAGEESTLISKARNELLNFLLGNRQGLTIIGPATVVKEIKKDPNKIELFTQEARSSSKKKRKKGSRSRK